jgi:glycosyltransferase involved in cell wall biosynthesis
MASRLQRWKGVHVFIDAAAQLARVRPEVRFMIVGGTLFGLEEDYATQLHQQVGRLNLGKVVHLVGYRQDVFRFYSAADVVVHCSIEPEPFGTVLLEAMVCSRPVIASDSGGSREIVEHGVTGVLVPPNDSEYLAKAILTLLDDPKSRLRMGEAGAARVRDYLSAERMTVQLQALYDEIAGKPKREPDDLTEKVHP